MAEIDNLSLDGFDLGAALGIAPEVGGRKEDATPGAGRHKGVPPDGRKAALAQGGI